MTQVGPVAQVILNSPVPQLDHPFDYLIPQELISAVQVGSLVRVPLRGKSRLTEGYVVALLEQSEFAGKLGVLDSVVSELPVLAHKSYLLARAVADRQAGTVPDVLRLMIPQRYVRAEKKFVTDSAVATDAASSAASDAASDADKLEVPSSDGHTQHTDHDVFVPQPGSVVAANVAPTLMQVKDITLPSWSMLMARQARAMWAQGHSAILVVPDFRDCEYLLQALTIEGLSELVVRMDAKLPGPDRYLNYLRALTPTPTIIVGNRAAIFTPCWNLGLISMWDEGDESYVERLAPYAHTRDVALVRQSLEQCALSFLAHSRSTDIQRLVELGFAEARQLPIDRKPKIIPTDLLSSDHTDSPARIPSSAYQAAREAVARGPILVQVAQPGFAPALACAACREIATCRNCSGPLGLPSADTAASCRWCGTKATGWTCAGCGSTAIRPIGSGSDRTAQDLGKAFPGTKVLVSSGDKPMVRVTSEPQLVVATYGSEPIADGGYHLILLLDGDQLRAREQLRVVENLLRRWSNSISLLAPGGTCYVTGSGERLGLAVSTWNMEPIVQQELQERLSAGLPPARRLVALEGTPRTTRDARDALMRIDECRVVGTVPIDDQSQRILLSFSYRSGSSVAAELKAQIIKAATTKFKLRVKMDYSGVDEQ